MRGYAEQSSTADRAVIPAHVAAYAAALHHAGVGSWGTVAVVVGHAFGRYRSYTARELAAAGTAWAREHVTPGARRRLRELVKAGRQP